MMTAPAVTEDQGARREYLAMLARLRRLERLDITVGIHGSDSQRDGSASNATIGAVHEFGDPARKIPKRSWLRSTLDRERGAILDEMDNAIDDVAQGANPQARATEIGLLVVEEVREGIRRGIKPPLSEMTLERRRDKRGSKPANESFGERETPLIDTGQMIQSIKAVVTKRGD